MNKKVDFMKDWTYLWYTINRKVESNMKKMVIMDIIVSLCIGILNFFPQKIMDLQTRKNKELVEQQMDQMSLEEKIAQMFLISYRSDEMDSNLQRQLQYKPGGFILFQENFTSYSKTIQFIEEIEKTAEIPMWIAIDQEGGRVQRIKALEDVHATEIPPMMDLGKTNQSELAYEVGKVLAKELQVFGIHMNFAPVLDVVENEQNKVIGNRSFGADVKLVSKMGIAVARGLEENGVIPVYKHFPGHGSTITDSHSDLPVLTKSKEELLASDWIPFQNAIENNAEVIMVGHLAIPSITGDATPATLSKAIVTDLLKQEMGFQGLVVSDALNMGALVNHYSEKEIYCLAIQAGVDLLLMPNDLERAIFYVKEGIQEGRVSLEQINTSVRKILMLKNKKINKKRQPKEILGSIAHRQIIQKIYP